MPSDIAPGFRLLVGLGKPDNLTAALRRAASIGARQARKIGAPSLAWLHPQDAGAGHRVKSIG